jgi:diguanylate cyclase (GGDEF)-like protein/PAS domain S-box-containing protein
MRNLADRHGGAVEGWNSKHMEILSPAEMHLMLNELVAQRVDLELQNKELRRVNENLLARFNNSGQPEPDIYNIGYHGIIENAPVGIFQSTPQGQFIHVNPFMARLYGYASTDDMLASITSISSQIYVDYSARDEFQRILAEQGVVTDFVGKNYRKDKSIVWTQTTARAIKDAQGQVLLYEGFITDISERIRSEQALREEENLLKQMVAFTEELLKTNSTQAAYQKILENLLVISKAQYGAFTLLNEATGKFTTVAVAGLQASAKKLIEVFGFEMQGKEWHDYSIENEKLKGKIISRFSSMRELLDDSIPILISEPVEKLLKMGEVVVTKVIVNNVMLGDFTLIMPAGKQFENDYLVGIYLRQIDMLLTRFKADDQLRESEKKYRTLFDSMMDGVYRSTHAGKFVDVNPAMVNMFGYASKEELLAIDIKKELYFTPEERASHILDSGQQEIEVYSMRRKDGSEVWVEDHGYYVKDEQGNILFHEGLLRDVTARKLADEKVRESEERLAAVMEGSQLGYSDWNIQTGEIRRNERWAGMLGYTLQEIESTYQQWEDLMHPDDRSTALQAIQDHLAGKTLIHRDEYRLRAKDGSYRWILDQGKVIKYDDQGHPLRMTATHTDITERKQAEDQLLQLSRAVEYSPAAIMITDKDGKIEYVNPKFSKLNGYTLQEMRGKIPRILKSEQESGDFPSELWQTIRSGKEWRGEILNHRKGGDAYWSSTSISAIVDSRGNITHFVSLNEDISARKAAEEKIYLLNVELEKLALTDFLTNLYNRRYFMQRGAEEFKRANRNGHPLALLMLDIDEFKKVNDTFGHEAGDLALQQVAAVMKSSLREIDLLGRLGGEEFAVLLSETSFDEAVAMAERIRQTIANISFLIPGGAKIGPITVSIGVAVTIDGMSGLDDLLRNADAALYYAKNNGRNRVVGWKFAGLGEVRNE